MAALRQARVARYDSAAAMETYREAHGTCQAMAKAVAALAALPLLVAIA